MVVIAPHGKAPAWRIRHPRENIDWLIDLHADFPEGLESVARLIGQQPSPPTDK